MTKHVPATCTVQSAITGACGKPAVWSDGCFAECAEHVKDSISLSRSSVRHEGRLKVGDLVQIEAYGLAYAGSVVWVGRKNCHVEITKRSGESKTLARPMSEITKLEKI